MAMNEAQLEDFKNNLFQFAVLVTPLSLCCGHLFFTPKNIFHFLKKEISRLSNALWFWRAL